MKHNRQTLEAKEDPSPTASPTDAPEAKEPSPAASPQDAPEAKEPSHEANDNEMVLARLPMTREVRPLVHPHPNSVGCDLVGFWGWAARRAFSPHYDELMSIFERGWDGEMTVCIIWALRVCCPRVWCILAPSLCGVPNNK
jgi:hypothetical protein